MFGKNHLMRQLLVLLFLVLAVGTVGYSLIEEGWTLFDGLYMTLITLTTIGFSEVHELSDMGRLLTIGIIIFGLGSAATIFTQLAQLMMEGNIFAVWRKRRMDKELSRMKDHVIICGYGRIGEAICRDLTSMGVQCVVLDRNEERGHGASVRNIPVLTGEATSDMVLLNAGIRRAKILVAALPNDADNLFVALAARDLNQDLIVIARGEDKTIETRMLRAGVDRVVYPAQLGGGQIARLIGGELGQKIPDHSGRRETDVLGYDLQVYRNFNREPMDVAAIVATTGALNAVAYIDGQGHRHNAPDGSTEVAESEAVVLLTEMGATSPQDEQDNCSMDALEESLSVGIPSIDAEHQQILHLIRRLKDVRPEREREVTHEVLAELKDYTAHHFHFEEKLFLSVGFPMADEHIAEHRALIAKVEQMISDRAYLHRHNLSQVLRDWLVDHIQNSDREYAEYMQCVSTEWGG